MKNKKTILVASLTVIALGAVYKFDMSATSPVEPVLTEATKSTESSTETTPSTLISQAPEQGESAPSLGEIISESSNSSLLEELFPEGDPAWAWAKVDLDGIRNDIPENLYWTYGAPTQDESLLALREESKAHWKAQFAKVLSNTATEQEIEDYYAHQQAISTDYVEFATILLNRHHQDLPERDYAMQTLARNLHLGRLEEIPGNLNKALERAKQHKQNQQAWLDDKESYEAELARQREEALRELGKI